MHKRLVLKSVVLTMAAGIALSFSIMPCFAENITITTYYPAPYGVYKELTTTSNTYLATEGGSVNIGTTEPSSNLKLDVEGKTGATEYCDENAGNCFSSQSVRDHIHPLVHTKKRFSSSGTWVKPESVTSVSIEMAGAGGGSGAGGWQNRLSGAGGGGAMIEGQITLPIAETSYSITVGQGGAGGSSHRQGGAGGASKFSNLLIARGGQGGCPGITSYVSPGMGGQGGTYTLNIALDGIATNGTQRTYSGGAPCYGEHSSSKPNSAGVYGGGESTRAATGNAGKSGYVTIEYFVIEKAVILNN